MDASMAAQALLMATHAAPMAAQVPETPLQMHMVPPIPNAPRRADAPGGVVGVQGLQIRLDFGADPVGVYDESAESAESAESDVETEVETEDEDALPLATPPATPPPALLPAGVTPPRAPTQTKAPGAPAPKRRRLPSQ